MTKLRKNPKVDAYLSRASRWRNEMAKLRAIVLGCGLSEELKWGKPCYALETGNVVLIVGFKHHCALLFCKGALLKDARGILIKPGAHSQAARQARFTSVGQIAKCASTLNAYVREAIAIEKSGRDVKYRSTSEFAIPDELKKQWAKDPALKAAFAALTPGRQRGYLIYFSAPKQSKTREARIAKYRPQILQGYGIHDAFKKRR